MLRYTLTIMKLLIFCTCFSSFTQQTAESGWEVLTDESIHVAKQEQQEADNRMLDEYCVLEEPFKFSGMNIPIQEIRALIVSYLSWEKHQKITIAPEETIERISMSALSKRIIYLTHTDTILKIYVYDIELARMIVVFEYALDILIQTYITAISDNGVFVAYGFEDGTIDIFDLETGQRKIIKTEDRVRSICFAHDPRVLLICYAHTPLDIVQGGIQIWNWADAMQLHTLGKFMGDLYPAPNREQFIRLKTVNKNNVFVYAMSKKRSIRIFKLVGASRNENGEQLPIDKYLSLMDFDSNIGSYLRGESRVPQVPDFNFIYCVALSKYITYIAIHAGTYIEIWHIKKNEKIDRLAHQVSTFSGTDFPHILVLSPDNKFLLLAFLNHTLKVWNIQEKNLTTIHDANGKLITNAAFSPDSKYIIAGYNVISNLKRPGVIILKNQAQHIADSLVAVQEGAVRSYEIK
jgi:hypothetical protein